MRYLVLLLILVSCGNNPKYKVGDCVDMSFDDEWEFIKPENHIRKILAVGKEFYMYQYYNVTSESEIELIDRYSQKVDCPEGY